MAAIPPPSGCIVLPLLELILSARQILAAALLRRSCGRCMYAALVQTSSVAARKEFEMTITIAHIQPLIALVAGVLILLVPRLLNYVVALYLIVVGLVGLNAIHHFIK
jgi:hypothetical protein